MENTPSILVIDDDEISNLISLNVLKDIIDENRIKFFKSGLDALNYLKEIGHLYTSPELILLDIDMPLLDGFEFIEKIRQLPFQHLHDIPIAILSNSDHPYDVINSKKAGIRDYLLKPLDKNKIANLLDSKGIVKI
jgi:CheY-like chemotaxis protein